MHSICIILHFFHAVRKSKQMRTPSFVQRQEIKNNLTDAEKRMREHVFGVTFSKYVARELQVGDFFGFVKVSNQNDGRFVHGMIRNCGLWPRGIQSKIC